MRAIKKEPGRRPEVVEIQNELKPLQEAVGGYIDAVDLPGGLVIICNEEGLLNHLPFNTFIAGHYLFGPILIVGDGGEEFADVPDKYVQPLLAVL